MTPEDTKKQNDKKEKSNKENEEKEIKIHGTVIRTKIYFDNESFFNDLVLNIKKSEQLKPTVAPEKQKIENKISQLKQKQKENGDKSKQNKNEKNKMAELILQKSGRISDKTKKAQMRAEAQNLKNAANEQPDQQTDIQTDIRFCEGALSFLDTVSADIDKDIKDMNNILLSGTPQSYSRIVGFQVAPLPSERGKDQKNDVQKANDKNNDKNNNNGKNPQPKKDNQQPEAQTQPPVSTASDNRRQEQAPQPVDGTTNQAGEQSAQNKSGKNMPEAIRKLRFSPTIEQKPINKTPVQQSLKIEKNRDI